MKGIDEILGEHPFFAGLTPERRQLIAGCARNQRFDAGTYLLREGEAASEFFLIRHGRVALQIAAPGREPVTIATLDPGQIVGASWLVPPYRWTIDARALELTRVIAIDAACLRGKCEEDHHLGYDMMKRFLPILIDRLHAARLQILDVYGRS
jgi:CRP/FNR family transcriptional regulator, cyclic AMP receptor protein